MIVGRGPDRDDFRSVLVPFAGLAPIVSQRVGVCSLERDARAFAARWLDLEGLTELLGRYERPRLPLVARLTAALPSRRRVDDRRLSLTAEGSVEVGFEGLAEF